MATTNTTLYKIELPSLSSNSFGSDLRQAFENIDSNFQKLSTLGLTTGEDGAPSVWVPFNLNCVFCSLVDEDFKKGDSGFSDAHIDAINKSFEKYNDITSLDRESYQKICKELYEQLLNDLPDDNHPVSAVNTYKHKWELDFQPFKNNGLLLKSYKYYIPFTPGDLLVAINLEKDIDGNKSFNIVGSTSHIYIDPRFRNQYSIEGNANTDDLSQATDQSCVVYVKPCQADTDHPYGFAFEYVHAFPRIYCAEDGQFYLTINGIDTNIPLTGKTGSAGKDGNIVTVMMAESESENIDGIVYEGTPKVAKIDRYIEGENGTSISEPQSLDKCPAFIFPPSGYGSYGTFYWVGYLNWDGEELTAYCGRENLITTDMYEHTFGGMMMGLDMYEKSKARPAGNSPWYKPRGLMLPIGTRACYDYWDPRDDTGAKPNPNQFGAHIIYSKKPEDNDLKTELHIGSIDDYRRIGEPDDINNNTDYPSEVQENPVTDSELIVDENVTAHKFIRKDDDTGQILLGTGDSTVKITKNSEGTITKSPLRFINSTIANTEAHADLKGGNDREYYFEADLQAILPLEAGYYYSQIELTKLNINDRGAYIGLTLNGAKADNPTDHRFIYYMNSRTSDPALVDEYIIPVNGYMYFLSTEKSEIGDNEASWDAPAGKIAAFITNGDNKAINSVSDEDWPIIIEDYARIDAMEQIVDVTDSENNKKSMSIFPYNFQRRVNKRNIPSSIPDVYNYTADTGPVNLTGNYDNYTKNCTDVINVCDFTGYTHGYLIKQENSNDYIGVVELKTKEGNKVHWYLTRMKNNGSGLEVLGEDPESPGSALFTDNPGKYKITCNSTSNAWDVQRVLSNDKLTPNPYKLNEMFRFWMTIPKKIKCNWLDYDANKTNPNYTTAVAKFNEVKNKYAYLWIVNKTNTVVVANDGNVTFNNDGYKYMYWRDLRALEGASSQALHNNLDIREYIETHACNKAIKLPKGWIHPQKNPEFETVDGTTTLKKLYKLDKDYYLTFDWINDKNFGISCDRIQNYMPEKTSWLCVTSIWYDGEYSYQYGGHTETVDSQTYSDMTAKDRFNLYMSYAFGRIVQDTNNGTPIIASYKPDLGWNTSWRNISIKNALNALVFNLDNQASQTEFDSDAPYVSTGLSTLGDDYIKYDGSEVYWSTGTNALFDIRGNDLITMGYMNLKIGSFTWDVLINQEDIIPVNELFYDPETRKKLHNYFTDSNNATAIQKSYKFLADNGWCNEANWGKIKDSNDNVTDYILPFTDEMRKVYYTWVWASNKQQGDLRVLNTTILPRVSLMSINAIQHNLSDDGATWTKIKNINDTRNQPQPAPENEGGNNTDPNASTEPLEP